MNQLVVTLIVILFPGIISCVIAEKITTHKKWDAFKYGLYSFVLGMLSYAILQIIFFCYDMNQGHLEWTYLTTWEAATSDNPSISFKELMYATLIGVPLAYTASLIINYKVFNYIAQKIRVSRKYGDENLYSYFLNSEDIDWVAVRDLENDLLYYGRVVSYSENENIQEIVLSEVDVLTNEESIKLYSVPAIYLCRSSGEFIIESIDETVES